MNYVVINRLNKYTVIHRTELKILVKWKSFLCNVMCFQDIFFQ